MVNIMSDNVASIQLANMIDKITISERISRLWTTYRHPFICNMPIAHEKAQLIEKGKVKLYLEDCRGNCFTQIIIGKRHWHWKQ
jgi:hypothetical protein